MKDNIIRTAVCPLCGRTYHGAPALSREDNKTLICPDCGTSCTSWSTSSSPRQFSPSGLPIENGMHIREGPPRKAAPLSVRLGRRYWTSALRCWA
mgnify:CR=1 FL=1